MTWIVESESPFIELVGCDTIGASADEFRMGRAGALPGGPCEIRLVADGETSPGPLLEYAPVPVMHAKLQAVFVGLGISNIEYSPAVLRNIDDSREWLDYVCFNVVGRVRGVDDEASEYRPDDGVPNGVIYSRLVLHVPTCASFDLFRLHERPELLVVSHRVRAAIEKAGIDRLRFFGPAEWSG